MVEASAAAYKVSELTNLIRETMEGAFPSVTVEGEITNFKAAASGHWYLNLSDDAAMIRVVMFRGRNSSVAFKPADGQLVRVTGHLSVYAKRGEYQINAQHMQLAGVGELLRILEERRRSLAAEGLFDEDRKRELPVLPARIAVVTSPTGAAIRDILQVLRRRNSGVSVVVLPAPVQGAGAAERIAAQIQQANHFSLADVLIVGRGGGSLEDLMPFSEESVVRAVAGSVIPVVSAVGHEVDWTLSDYAADVRAPTPSAAAELVAGAREELSRQIHGILFVMMRDLRFRLGTARNLVKQFSREELLQRFRGVIAPKQQRLDDARELLVREQQARLIAYRSRLALAREAIVARSPQDVLRRGYAIIRDHDGVVLTRFGGIASGSRVHIQMQDQTRSAELGGRADNEDL